MFGCCASNFASICLVVLGILFLSRRSTKVNWKVSGQARLNVEPLAVNTLHVALASWILFWSVLRTLF